MEENKTEEFNEMEENPGTETKAEETQEEAGQEEAAGEELSELEKKEQEIKDLNDKYLRLYSEFDNFRRRTQKEKLELYKNAGEDIFKSLLPVVDDFERAQKSMEETQDYESLKSGLDLIYNKLIGVFKSNGVNSMDAAGKDFDSEIHEAITQIPAPDKSMVGKVVDVVEKGYTLNEKVIRYAKVVVGQ